MKIHFDKFVEGGKHLTIEGKLKELRRLYDALGLIMVEASCSEERDFGKNIVEFYRTSSKKAVRLIK